MRKRKVDRESTGKAKGGKAKSTRKIVEYNGYEWYATEKFKIERLLGKMVAAGEVPGRTNIKAGTVLYKVLWVGYPPEVATWEEERSIHDDFIDEYEASLEEDAEAEAAAAAEAAADEESGGEES